MPKAEAAPAVAPKAAPREEKKGSAKVTPLRKDQAAPKSTEKLVLKLDAIQLEAFRAAYWAAAPKDSAKEILKGVVVNASPDHGVRLYASDGYVMLRRQLLEADKTLPVFQAVIERESLYWASTAALKAPGVKDGLVAPDVKLTIGGGKATMTFPGGSLEIRTIVGETPDFEKILAAEGKAPRAAEKVEVGLDPSKLVQVIRALGLETKDAEGIVQFAVKNSTTPTFVRIAAAPGRENDVACIMPARIGGKAEDKPPKAGTPKEA